MDINERDKIDLNLTLLITRPPKTCLTKLSLSEGRASSFTFELIRELSSLSRKHCRNSWASSCWYLWNDDEKSDRSVVKDYKYTDWIRKN